MSVAFERRMEANRILRDVFSIACQKDECLRVAQWIADGGVVRVKGGELDYLTADQVIGMTRRGIG